MRPKSTQFASGNAQYSQNILDRLSESESLKIAGQHLKAIEVAQDILLDDPECVAAIEEIADNFLSLEQYEESEKATDHVLKIDPKSHIANYIKGFLELSAGNWKASTVYLTRANEGHPNNPEILRCLGWGMFHDQKVTEGIATLMRALQIRSDDPMILCDLGVCFLHCDYFERAVSLFERALEIFPDSERAYECLQAAKDLREKFPEGQGGGKNAPIL